MENRRRTAAVNRPRLLPVLAVSSLGILILMALGVWQMQQLARKEARLAAIEARLAAPAVGLGDILEQPDVDYAMVRLTGVFDHARERRMIAVHDRGPAYQIVTPLLTGDGILVLVARGAVPVDNTTAERPPGAVSITGQALRHDGGQGLFDPDNDEAGNIWYWWDIPAMLSGAAPLPAMRAAPFVVHRLPDAESSAYPRPQGLGVALRNNHLGYAITWFGLAAVLAAVAGAFIRQGGKQR